MSSGSPVLFYRATHRFGCFSNFYRANISIDGLKFICNEQYIMYQKAVLFNDKISADKILKSNNPMQIKTYGRAVKGFNEDLWVQYREQIADQCNRAKFTQHNDLRKILLSTGDALIAEASPSDKIWGIGVDELMGKNIKTWKGFNLLGKSLMRVREEIQSTYKKSQ